MKKLILTAVMIASIFFVLICGCGRSDSKLVGTYYLVTVTADDGSGEKIYTSDGSNRGITKKSFILEVKDNYRWDMIISLPDIEETEHGRWKEKEGACYLKEDWDDPEIVLRYNNGIVTFEMNENGYAMSVTLSKNF